MKPLSGIYTTLGFIMGHPANRASAPFLVIIAAAAAAVFSICWAPQWVSYSSLEGRSAQKAEQIRKTKTALAVQAVFKNVSEQVSALETKLSCRSTEGELSAGINKLARSAGLKLSIENSGSQKESAQGYDIIVQEITVNGGYRGLRSFLAGLENFDTITAIRRLKIESDGRKPGIIKASLQLAVYKRASGKAGQI
jgi:Tfp pilus assembly protein PilO